MIKLGMMEGQSQRKPSKPGGRATITYEREVPACRPGEVSVQQMQVSEYANGLVMIRLFVNGIFAGTWIKTAPHFCNILEWGNWKHCKTTSQAE
jgi:hypothetical protein